MKKFLSFIFLLSLIFFGAEKTLAISDVFYISPTGNDETGNGTESNPWKTFSKAISMVDAGDTIFVKPGIYNEMVSIDKSGTINNRIKIFGTDPENKAKIAGTTSPRSVFVVYGSNIDFANLEIYDSYHGDDNSSCFRVDYNSENIDIENILVHNCEGHGILLGGKNIELRDSEVYQASLDNDGTMNSGWQSGIKISGRDINVNQNIRVLRNVTRDNMGEGFAATKSVGVVAENNVSYNNFGVNFYVDNSKDVLLSKNFSYCIDGDGAILRDGKKSRDFAIGDEYYSDWGSKIQNVTILNNITYNCSGSIYIFRSQISNPPATDRNIKILNNTFTSDSSSNTGSTVYIADNDWYGITLKNNIFKSRVAGQKLGWSDENYGIISDYNLWVGGKPASSILSGANDVISSESALKFQSTLSSNPESFKIMSDSTAKDSGTDLFSYVYEDYFENSRPQNSLFDIGAHEFTSSSSPTHQVVFSEINWGGSPVSEEDEWIELYNTTAYDISLDGWKILGASGTLEELTIPNPTTSIDYLIPAGGYFVISNFSDQQKISGVLKSLLNVGTTDSGLNRKRFISTDLNLKNLDLRLELQNSSGTLSDIADDGSGAPFFGIGGCQNFSGQCKSMVRKFPITEGDLYSSWENAKIELNLQHEIPTRYNTSLVSLKGTPGRSESNSLIEGESMYSKGYTVSDSSASNGKARKISPSDVCSYCYLIFGPKSQLEIPDHWYRADFRLKVSDNSSKYSVARIAVTNTISGPYGKAELRGYAFNSPNTYQTFSIYYKQPASSSGSVDYSVWSHKTTDLYVDKIEITDLGLSTPQVFYEGENYTTFVGTKVSDSTSSNGFAVKSQINKSGFLSIFVNSNIQKISENYKATFKLKTSSKSSHKKIARIEIYNRGTKTFVYKEDIFADDPRFVNETNYFDFQTTQFSGSNISMDYRVVAYPSNIEVFYDGVSVEKV